MADAAKSDEIEDVLSSIRRLVSEHQPQDPATTARPREDAPAASQPTQDDTPQGDPQGQTEKLILTPALRVTDPEDPWLPITPQVADDNDLADDMAADAGTNGHDHVHHSDWAADLLAGSQVGDGPDDRPQPHDPQLQADQWDAAEAPDAAHEPLDADQVTLDVDDARDGRTKAGPAEVDGNTRADAAGDDRAGDDRAGDDRAGDDRAGDDTPLSFIRSTSSVRDYEPEEGDNGFEASDLPSAMRDLAQSRAARQERPQITPVGPDRDPARVRVEIVKAVIADELQDRAQDDDAPAASQETAEPVRDDGDLDMSDGRGADPADDSIPQHDPRDNVTDFLAVSPDQSQDMATFETGVEDLGESPFTFPDGDDSFVDEEALRDVIAEVVREELQGEMGVRITRNLRKLVRREIRLALAAQDLD